MKRILDNSNKTFWILLILMLVLVGCDDEGGAASVDVAGSDDGREAVPTMPAAQFTSVGAQSVLTETTEMATSTPVASEGPDLALGERVYTNRCAECHGAQAEGGSAAALRGLTTAEADFEDLLRTGGELGADHLFGTRAVSENGLRTMYAWLQSLSE